MPKPVFSAKHFHDEQAAFDHIEACSVAVPICHTAAATLRHEVISKGVCPWDGTVNPRRYA